LNRRNSRKRRKRRKRRKKRMYVNRWRYILSLLSTKVIRNGKGLQR